MSGTIADSFNSRTLANMEVALERACKVLGFAGEQHEARRYIASKIIECAEGGNKRLGGLTEAGQIAARETLRHPRLTDACISLCVIFCSASRPMGALAYPFDLKTGQASKADDQRSLG